jgi:hypothetical protein
MYSWQRAQQGVVLAAPPLSDQGLMATVEDNKRVWNREYNWQEAGDEWSSGWSGPDMQWYCSLLPRIHAFVPAPTILEIAPGFGRWTHYLKDLCDKLIVVDLAEACIRACQDRFAGVSNITYHVNDGRSLEMVPDGSIDFVFSFDSLVHAEADVLEAYVGQLARKMKPDAVGFIHHSNLGAFSGYLSRLDKIKRGRRWIFKLGLAENLEVGWRARSMTAGLFEQFATAAGLRCIGQEKANWSTRRLIDCMSIFTPAGSSWGRPNRILENPHFMREAEHAATLARLYGDASGLGEHRKNA